MCAEAPVLKYQSVALGGVWVWTPVDCSEAVRAL
jgi:hypothetical protein